MFDEVHLAGLSEAPPIPSSDAIYDEMVPPPPSLGESSRTLDGDEDELVFTSRTTTSSDRDENEDEDDIDEDDNIGVKSSPNRLADLAEQVARESGRLSCRPFPASLSSTSIHAFSDAEKVAFVKHINKVLGKEVELADRLPLDPASDEIFEAVKDGILLCKLINASIPGTVDESRMIKHFRDEKSALYNRITNHNLCIQGAKNMGAIVVNLGAEDLMEAKIGLLKEVTIEKHPELLRLKEGEEDMSNLPAEELLLKWVNYHMKKAGVDVKLSNFSADVQNSTIYAHLMHRLAPETCSLDALQEPDLLKRAEIMLADAERIGCRIFVTPEDVVAGNEKLNLVFVANMFNKHTGMVPIAEELDVENKTLLTDNQNLRETIQALENKVNFVMRERLESDHKLSVVEAENKQLSKLVNSLMHECEELAGKVHSNFELNEQLQKQIQSVLDEKQIVESSKRELYEQYESVLGKLGQISSELDKERIQLETSEFCGASLANDLEDLRSRQEKLEYLIEHLKMERMRSDMHVERLRILYNSFDSGEQLCQAIYKSLTLESIMKGASKMGYLTKKARNSNNWKYRFFVLRDNFLFYFRSDKDMMATASGVVRVDDASLRFAENPTRKDLKEQWLLCIEIPSSNDSSKPLSFYISGEDNELEGWKSQIQAAAGWWTKKSSFSTIKKQSSILRQPSALH